jgi:hypothetical protein
VTASAGGEVKCIAWRGLTGLSYAIYLLRNDEREAGTWLHASGVSAFRRLELSLKVIEYFKKRNKEKRESGKVREPRKSVCR